MKCGPLLLFLGEAKLERNLVKTMRIARLLGFMAVMVSAVGTITLDRQNWQWNAYTTLMAVLFSTGLLSLGFAQHLRRLIRLHLNTDPELF